jgi:hypothetical protein
MILNGGLLVLFWLVLILGMVASWTISLIVMWRAMKAHEQIAETLRIALLGKRPKPPSLEFDASEPAECMKCGGTIPPGQVKCPSCGWTYEQVPNETAEMFKQQRGF